MALGTFFAFLFIIISLAVYWIRKQYSTFEDTGFLHEKPEIPFGNIKGVGTKYHLIHIFKRLYDQFSKKAPVFGIYMFFRPNYVVTDLDLIKDILIKNFETFHNRGLFSSKEHDPLSAHLFTIEDQEWRNMRHKLTPTFTSGKMKMMFHTIMDVSNHMLEKLKTNTDLDSVDVKTVLASFMMNVIGNVAFGLEINSIDDPDCEFRTMAKKIFTGQNFFGKALLLANFRSLARKLGFKLIPKDISDFFRKVVKENLEYRLENNIERNDVFNLLMKIGTEGREGEEKLTPDEIAAQCFIFFIAGHETSANTTSFALYNLVKHPEIQERLREEIKNTVAKHDDKVTYEAMQEMKLLDKVVNETLRMYPPAGVAIRQASKNYHIPDTKFEIPEGALLFIPIYLIHNDSNHYSDPKKFNPERFNDENSAKRHPMAFMPFGDGPRNCIGNRFGLMQTKITLIQLLLNFRIHKTPSTPDEIIFNPKSPILAPMNDLLLKFEKL